MAASSEDGSASASSSEPSSASASTSTDVHFCVLVHGFWGNPTHLAHVRQTLHERHRSAKEALHILVAKSNASNNTYDGIEVGGERIANEVEAEIERLRRHGKNPVKFSIAGYSLGGLIARYAVGLLYSRGLFDEVKPMNFTTFATPHLGVRTPKLGYRARWYNFMASKTLSTSGRQMFLIDEFRETGRPLLAVMADPNSVFVKGLRLFRRKSIYANTTNDRSVPYYTSGIDKTDPYVDMSKVDVNYLPGQEDPVVLDHKHPVLPKKHDGEALTLVKRYSPTRATMSSVPFYATLLALIPVAMPLFLINAAYQTYTSAQRVRLHESGKAGILLSRYRIPLLEEAAAAQDRAFESMATRSREEYLPTPSEEEEIKSERGDVDNMAEDETNKNDSGFPTLALTPEQFEMIRHLDDVGIEKFPVYIKRHRHTHAAIIVRMPKEAFGEGKVVCSHWADRFEC